MIIRNDCNEGYSLLGESRNFLIGKSKRIFESIELIRTQQIYHFFKCSGQPFICCRHKMKDMNAIKLTLDDQKKGAFVIEDGEERLARMDVAIIGQRLVVYHTEVADKLKGQGIAGKILDEMVGYARGNRLKVVPLCPYVHAQFKRHAPEYDDVWEKNWRN